MIGNRHLPPARADVLKRGVWAGEILRFTCLVLARSGR
jgi:hypothetical protein